MGYSISYLLIVSYNHYTNLITCSQSLFLVIYIFQFNFFIYVKFLRLLIWLNIAVKFDNNSQQSEEYNSTSICHFCKVRCTLHCKMRHVTIDKSVILPAPGQTRFPIYLLVFSISFTFVNTKFELCTSSKHGFIKR